MSLKGEIIRGVALCSVVFALISCALFPPKKEVAVEAPPSAEEKQARQRLAKAEQAYQEGNLEAAAKNYRELAMDFPRTPQAAKALVRQGEIEFRMGRYAQAISWFQQVINRFPAGAEGDEARLWLLRCYVKIERFTDALQTGKSLVAHLPESSQRAEAAEILGDIEGGQSNYVQAVRWYIKSYALAGEEKQSILTAKVDGALGRLDRDLVLELLAEYPRGFPSLQLQTRMVELDMESGQLVMAQQQLQALIEKHPLHPLTETWKAMAEKVTEWLKVDMTTVGCILPLSGRYQGYGDKVLRGLLMAAEDAKARNQSGRGDIQLVIKDTGGSPDLAVAAVRDLVVNHRVAAIVGPLSRVAAEAAAVEAQNLWVPIITLTQKKAVSEIGDFVFRSFLSNEQQTRALAEYSVLGLGYTRFAILYPDDGYGKRLMKLFWDELDRLGAEVRGVETYEPSQTDFADQIKKLVGLFYPRPESVLSDESAQAKEIENQSEQAEGTSTMSPEEEPLPIVDFEALFIPDSYRKVGLIAPQLAFHDVTGIKLLGTNLWNSPELVEMAASYLQGAVFVDGFFPESRLPLTHQFVSRYQDLFGEKPGYPEAKAYDTMRLLMKALDQPGVASRPQLRDALLGVKVMSGVAGTASVEADGTVNNPPFLITILRKRMAEVQSDLESLRQRQSSLESLLESNNLTRTEEFSPFPPSTVPESGPVDTMQLDTKH